MKDITINEKTIREIIKDSLLKLPYIIERRKKYIDSKKTLTFKK